MRYLYPNQILFLHQKILEHSGGSPGVRDQGLLESAIYRPQATFGGEDLYPSLVSKVAALTYSLVKNHPFVDGNKRTAYEAMRLTLLLNGYDILATEQEKFNVMMRLAESHLNEDSFALWLQEHIK